MKLLYLHGLASGGQSATAKLLQKLLPEVEFVAPDIPVDAHDAMEMLRNLALSELSMEDIIVGTSMGGFYAQMMRGWRRILVNPSFHTSEIILRPNVGKTMPFFLPRRDGVQSYTITEELCRSLEDVESRQFDKSYGIQGMRLDTLEYVKAFFGLKDTLVNCRYEYLSHYTYCDFFDGGHRLDPYTMTHVILPQIHQWIAETPK